MEIKMLHLECLYSTSTVDDLENMIIDYIDKKNEKDQIFNSFTKEGLESMILNLLNLWDSIHQETLIKRTETNEFKNSINKIFMNSDISEQEKIDNIENMDLSFVFENKQSKITIENIKNSVELDLKKIPKKELIELADYLHLFILIIFKTHKKETTEFVRFIEDVGRKIINNDDFSASEKLSYVQKYLDRPYVFTDERETELMSNILTIIKKYRTTDRAKEVRALKVSSDVVSWGNEYKIN